MRIYLNSLAAVCSLKNSASMMRSKSSPPEQILQQVRVCHNEVDAYLLSHKIDVLVIFEVFEELDHVRMVL